MGLNESTAAEIKESKKILTKYAQSQKYYFTI